ncbi:MAG: DUF192 domain-containing protein [Candidatus Thiodiazotropha sp. (ex Cardiolucina cf. quadrata)]|nr:DUF192 domain-containing protein [Candidatus Thiodiazotropha sp. (ex Cardiolucina cf. quadrata)]
MKRIRLKRHATEDDPAKESPALEAWVADSYLTRLRGLLGKKRLDDSDGLLLERCASVHTFWMRYPLDLVFMDKKGKVVMCQEGVKPFRTASAHGAYYTLELNQGVISKQGISESDHFYW